MQAGFKKLFFSVSVVAMMGGGAVKAQAGDTANLYIDQLNTVTGVPPVAEQVLYVKGGTSDAVWDAVDGRGDPTASIEFAESANGNARITLKSSEGIDGGISGTIDVGDIVTEGAAGPAREIVVSAQDYTTILRISGATSEGDTAPTIILQGHPEVDEGNGIKRQRVAQVTIAGEGAHDFNANVYSNGSDTTFVEFQRSTNVTGQMGRAGQELEAIYVRGAQPGQDMVHAVVHEDVHADIYAFGRHTLDAQGRLNNGGMTVKKDVNGRIVFGDGGAVAIDSTDNGNIVTGRIEPLGETSGTLILFNDSENNAAGNVTRFEEAIEWCGDLPCTDSAGLQTIQITGSAKAEFTDKVRAEQLLFAGSRQAASAKFSPNVNLYGDVAVMPGSHGTLEFDGRSTVAGGMQVDQGTLNLKLGTNDVDFDSARAIDVNGRLNIEAANPNADLTLKTGGAMRLDGAVNSNMAGGVLTLQGDKGLAIGSRANTDMRFSNAVELGSDATIGAAGTTTTVRAIISDDYDPRLGTPVIDAKGHKIVQGDKRAVMRFKLEPGNSTLQEGDTVTFIANADDASKLDAAFRSGFYGFMHDKNVTYLPVTLNNGEVTARVTFQDVSAGKTGVEKIVLQQYDAEGDLFALRNRYLLAQNQGQVDQLSESVLPVVDDVARMNYQVAVQSVNIARGRMAALREPDVNGLSAGDGVMANGMGVWTQAYGQTAEQGARSGTAGYSADTYGLAIGVDTAEILDNAVLGMGVGYTRTDMTSNSYNRSKTHIDSYQVSAYGNYDLPADAYVSGVVGYARNSAAQTRFDVGTIEDVAVRGDSKSRQYIAYTELGKRFDLGGGLKMTPHVLAHYQYLLMDAYTERGSTLGLHVDESNRNILEFGGGVTLEQEFRFADYSTLSPSVRLGYRHDVLGDDVSTSARFTGGGAAFSTEGLTPARGVINAGVGLNYTMEGDFSFDALYDYEHKDAYHAHSGVLRAAKKF